MRFYLNLFTQRRIFQCRLYFDRCLSQNIHKTKICIVGSGPAGFYTAQHLLRNSNIEVDIYEKLPVPFGLIRYGVAPDHPEIKNVINSFTKIAKNKNCNFYGNVNIGVDVTVSELLKSYNATVLAYGASDDQPLNIPGKDLGNVFSARSFVAWYNGLPEDTLQNVCLNTDTAVIIGHGNVALDVARVLLRNIDELQKTDVTEHALQVLRKSQLKRVVMVGRRGPLQAAFTIKEVREMTKLKDCRNVLSQSDFEGIAELVPSIQRPRKRLTELMLQTLEECQNPTQSNKEFELKFYRTPKSILPDANNKVGKFIMGVNKPENSPDSGKVKDTGEEEEINCGLVITSVGYRSKPIDPSIPFDDTLHLVPNKHGKVTGSNGVYCSGWVKTGPKGVIPSTMNGSYETGEKILIDLKDGHLVNNAVEGSSEILALLKNRGVIVTSFDDWQKIDELEQDRGRAVGKPREKIIDSREMLKAAGLL